MDHQWVGWVTPLPPQGVAQLKNQGEGKRNLSLQLTCSLGAPPTLSKHFPSRSSLPTLWGKFRKTGYVSLKITWWRGLRRRTVSDMGTVQRWRHL